MRVRQGRRVAAGPHFVADGSILTGCGCCMVVQPHVHAGMDQNASRLFEAARLGAVQRDGENSLLVAAIDVKLGMSLFMQGARVQRWPGWRVYGRSRVWS